VESYLESREQYNWKRIDGRPTPRANMAEEEACDEEAVCYLCLDGDESGQPLRRDCACRGTDAGFVHVSCLTGFAAAKVCRLLV
jgi:E3 ubiquitin-protein ligase DOA10